ncbi:hypothetical protein SSE37_09473 [Sagittula stellata E-37]|uniref:DUF3096 domain-containing protein n=1 Tax=Sagittula stellata (strain ATCC 700073 / DSM 11524 / E-37) TaxID=388399 RepID=A3KAL1_SAGS3|nr:hypothetical protein SSE37_09473 [Sagittula stellata E-37]
MQQAAHDAPPQSGALAMYANPILAQSLLALVAGVVILVAPRVLNYVIAAYLIAVGLSGLFLGMA